MAKQTTGEFLALLRKANGYTQQEVAEKLNISNRTLSSWETDRTMPDLLLLPAIADLYGVTIDELLRGERGEFQKPAISDNAMRAASKNRFGRFSAKAALLTGLALGASLFIELGCILLLYTSSPAWLDVLFWVLGLAGMIACLACLFYFKNSLKLAEGVVLNEDYTDEKKAILFTAQHRAAKSVAICAIPFIAAAVIFLLLFAILNPQNYYILNVEIAVRDAYIGVFLSNFIVGMLILTGYLCIEKSAGKKLANESQREIIRHNSKLLKKICAFGTIPFGVLLIIFFSLYIAFPEGCKTIYSNDDYRALQTHMQTLVIEEGGFNSDVVPVGEYYLSFPTNPDATVKYDLGNGFYGRYYTKSSPYGFYWDVLYGETYPFSVWSFDVYDIDTPVGEMPIVNVRYYINEGLRIIQSEETYVVEQDISDTLYDVIISLSFGITVATVSACTIIYAKKRRKQDYSF
ncbi:MAG: helix-turn-helix domain-containing protein [Clostridia bacterium]|nr:helix-turn-helix domain-containing protein [Clostridia bacterium]